MRITFEKAVELLKNGHVAAVPTETVYGLAASLSSPKAVEKIFTLKGRPSNNPLIIHIASQEQLDPFVKTLPNGFEKLAKAFWPGPLTLVLAANTAHVPELVRAGLPTAAFRIPAHPLIRNLLALTGPLVMPSANISGKPSATSPGHVESDLGVDFPVLDGGKCARGVESTILFHDGNQWKIIRLGALAPEVFKPILGYQPAVMLSKKGEDPICPGQLYRHYAPKAKLILTKTITPETKGAVIGFSDRNYPSACQIFPLGPLSMPEKVAENLYAVLRNLDEERIETAWVDMDMPDEGLWQTILERLNKASQAQS